MRHAALRRAMPCWLMLLSLITPDAIFFDVAFLLDAGFSFAAFFRLLSAAADACHMLRHYALQFSTRCCCWRATLQRLLPAAFLFATLLFC